MENQHIEILLLFGNLVFTYGVAQIKSLNTKMEKIINKVDNHESRIIEIEKEGKK